jgi:hypothetical protein
MYFATKKSAECDKMEHFSKVYKATSQLMVNDPYFEPREGLFANKNIAMGEVICAYSAKLTDWRTAKEMDPKYWFDMSGPWRKAIPRNYQMFGDDVDGHPGLYCNRLPKNVLLHCNAFVEFDNSLTDLDHILRTKQIKSFLIARKGIRKDEEIVLRHSRFCDAKMKNFKDKQSKIHAEAAEAPKVLELPTPLLHEVSEPNSLEEFNANKRIKRT